MNNTTTQKVTFWKFLEDPTVEIPIIQRDYAQGRKGKEELRKKFLTDLKFSLDNNTELKLDFVYGSKENDRLNPLDGQQRLTTLWLMHWYIAYKAGELTDKAIVDRFKKFTYETRVSSREFCEHLSEFSTEMSKEFQGTISDFIQQQTWFYSAWKQDPTIQAMLRMLSGIPDIDKNGNEIIDGLEELFKDYSTEQFKSYWKKLTEQDNQKCPIVFYYLDLQGLNLSDDLYIKMNARGEPLTSFENFKADLVGYIKKESESPDLVEAEKEKWKTFLDPTTGIPIKMDTTGTDIVWKNKTEDGKIDEIYFAFLNRFFLNELFIAKDDDKYLLDIGEGDENATKENENKTYKYLNDSDLKIAYSGLDIYKYRSNEIPSSLFEKLQNILNKYAVLNIDIPACEWDKGFHFIPQYEKDDKGNLIEIENNAGIKVKKVTVLNQVQRIVFFALCKYFSESGTDNEESLKRWMRVIWNLVSGTDNSGRLQIRNTLAMRNAIEFIGKLDSHDVYTNLKDYKESIGDSDFDLRCKEEIEKAKQILAKEKCSSSVGPDEQTIIEAENYAFFNGAIRFLFHNGEGKVDWSKFDTKWENVKAIIPSEVNKRETIEKVIPSLNDDFLKKIFQNCNLSNDDNNLRILLLKFYKEMHSCLINEKQEKFSPLCQYLLKLCKQVPSYRIHLWNNIIILSNYSTRRGNYEENSFIIDNVFLQKRVPLLKDCKDIEYPTEENPIMGLYINFKYQEYSFRWQYSDWVDMYEGNKKLFDQHGDYEQLHTHFNGKEDKLRFTDAQSLIDNMNRCINEYNKLKSPQSNASKS